MSFPKLCSFLIILHHLPANFGLFETSRFHLPILKSSYDCYYFGKSFDDVAHTKAYFNAKKNEFFLNKQMTFSLMQCARVTHQNITLKTIIYEIMDLDFKNDHLRLAINYVHKHTPTTLELVALLRMFLGPGGLNTELVSNLNISALNASFICAPSERESMTGAYDQDTFNEIGMVENNPLYDMFLWLNGWHLKNMGQIAYIPREAPVNITGFIIHVEAMNSALISTHDGTKFVPDAKARLILDMAYSPDFIDCGQLRCGEVLMLILAVLINILIIVYQRFSIFLFPISDLIMTYLLGLKFATN